VRVQGTAHRFASARDAIAAGLGMVHQEFSLVPALTVAENVALGGRGRFDRATVGERVRALGAETGLLLDPDAVVSSLPVSARISVDLPALV
jgi:simple sugar transport system ATP-binding protein